MKLMNNNKKDSGMPDKILDIELLEFSQKTLQVNDSDRKT